MSRPRKRNNRRNKNKGKSNKSGQKPHFINNKNTEIAGRYEGVLEITSNGYGFIRPVDYEFTVAKNDPFLKPNEIKDNQLRPGLVLNGQYEQDQKGNRHVYSIDTINGHPPNIWHRTNRFEHQTPIMPVEYIELGKKSDNIEMRIIDLVSPVGKGQRGLIVAPPRTGKTVLLKQIASSIAKHHPDINLNILLVDERPEEVTDFLRTTEGNVFASSNDKPNENHIRVTELALAYVKRKAEMGEDNFLLIDSLTRLSRAYNTAQSNSGRTLSGGLDIRALEIPKKIFGSARKIEGGGSLTIISTCLVETNSRMDDLIFEEFKGTGNMELVLDRDLANDRIYPAINIAASGTRNEDKFIPGSMDERVMVRRYLLKKQPKESMRSLLQVLKNTQSNEELLNQIAALA